MTGVQTCALPIYFRFGTASSVESLQSRVTSLLEMYLDDYAIDWTVGALPFLTADGVLRKVVIESVNDVMGYPSVPSTGGGTSDGRFIAKTGAEIVELGLLHATAHQVDEQVTVADIENLAAIYERVLQRVLL